MLATNILTVSLNYFWDIQDKEYNILKQNA